MSSFDPTYKYLRGKIGQSFPAFINHVLKEFSTVESLSAMDVHWMPLYVRCNYCDVHYDVIGKLDTFSQDLSYIASQKNLTFNIDMKVNSVSKSRENALKRFSQLSKKVVDKLFERYRIDFEMFDYSVDEYMHHD